MAENSIQQNFNEFQEKVKDIDQGIETLGSQLKKQNKMLKEYLMKR